MDRFRRFPDSHQRLDRRERTRHTLVAALGILCVAASCRAIAWTDHDLLTHQALQAMPPMRTVVLAEPIEDFLKSDPAQLVRVLNEEEAWDRAHIPLYPARPDALRFTTGIDKGHVLRRFLQAARLNPDVRLRLFIQDLPGVAPVSPTKIAWTDVTTLRSETVAKDLRFSVLRAGTTVSVLDVIGTASDEPDYGLDIGLWENNTSGIGKAYGFGKQPFGNPALEISTQAPFHMGFFHEGWLIEHAAPYLQRALPEYRVHLFQTLSAYAFRSGHPYWGWRFAGWALHYVQDLTQPYHASALPGVNPIEVIFVSAVDLVGIHGPKTNAIQLVSNRHLELENYVYHRFSSAMAAKRDSDAFITAVSDARCDKGYPPWGPASLREEVSLEAERSADKIDAELADALPAHLVSDPRYVFTESDPNVPNMADVMQAAKPARRATLDAAIATLMCHVGAQTRRFVATFLPLYEPPAAATPPQ